MNVALPSMHGRILCHATERLERVERALREVFGDSELEVRRTIGHHGNEIVVVEAVTSSMDLVTRLFSRLPTAELEAVVATLEDRIDDSCNLFVRLDKQCAFKGKVRLAGNDDVVAIRIKVRAFPAKKASAMKAVSDVLRRIRDQASAGAESHDSFK